MRKVNLEEELNLVRKAQDSYKSSLDRVISSLLGYSLKLMEEKKVAIKLTQEFDSNGNYLEESKKKNGCRMYYAFPEGIILIEKVYDDKGLPKTKESLISREEFLSWVRGRFERTEDVYKHLIDYRNKKPVESHFPVDLIL